MADALWTIDEIIAATRGTVEGKAPAEFTGVSIDSRTIAPAEIFVAIKGDSLDGHDYVARALEAGAGLAIVERVEESARQAGALLVVPDALKALEALGRAARARTAAQIIAVTGSVGKTTTKEALKVALKPSGKVHASPASFNNHWGVPLTLARMPADTDFGVFEIGMSSAGEIRPLVGMVRPHVSIITQIAESHIGYFTSLDGIAEAKAEIFEGVEPEGSALIIRDTTYFDYLAGKAKDCGIGNIYSFGETAGSDIHATAIKLHQTCSCVSATLFGEAVTFKAGAPGRHVAANLLAVLGAARLAGADAARAALALADFSAAGGRGARHELQTGRGTLVLIDESYNANPASMRAALALLGGAKPGRAGRRIAVLGDMLELGDQSARIHGELDGPVDEAGVDVLYACGAGMKALWSRIDARHRGHYAPTSDGLQERLLKDLRGGDVVMIKGSLGSKMGPLVKAIMEHFKPAGVPATGSGAGTG